MNTNQRLANNVYFKSVLNQKVKIYVWKDAGLVYEIKDDKFVCDTPEKKSKLRNITTTKFYNNNTTE